MRHAVKSPWRVPFDGSFKISKASTKPPKGAPSSKVCRTDLAQAVDEISDLERRLNAERRWAMLLEFQAMDAAGKDGTIRAVMAGVDQANVVVHSFKAPSPLELDHDFLWRTSINLPGRGQIGVFNRSYYEEVLVVRVHPQFLEAQRLPDARARERLWKERFQSIRDHERHLARNGTAILKFWLNVSKEEQRQRFLSRLEEREKYWKFRAEDVAERQHWDEYMSAYQEMLRETSRPWAPWYAIPADDKEYMRLCVARIVVDSLRALDPKYPRVADAELDELNKMKKLLRDRKV